MPTPWACSRLPAVSVHIVAGVIVAVAACAGAPDSSASTVAIGVARATHQRERVMRMAPPWCESVAASTCEAPLLVGAAVAGPNDDLRAVGGALAVGVQALARLCPGDGAVGVDVPLLAALTVA